MWTGLMTAVERSIENGWILVLLNLTLQYAEYSTKQ